MAETPFSKKINKLLNEYGYMGMNNKMPVQQAQWPETVSATAPAEPSNDVPPGSETTVVTNGETTPMGEPRADVTAQNGEQFDSDTMGEVGSLLITIGHLLAQDGHVSDKFDTPSVIAFLSKNFQVIPSVDQAPDSDEEIEVIPSDNATQPSNVAPVEQPPMPMGANYMEQRKMFESKFKKQ